MLVEMYCCIIIIVNKINFSLKCVNLQRYFYIEQLTNDEVNKILL